MSTAADGIQPSISDYSHAIFGWNVTSAVCDPVWHVSSSSGVATSVSELPYPCCFVALLLHSGCDEKVG